MNLFITKKFGTREYRVFLPLMWFVVVLLLGICFVGFSENRWSMDSHFYSFCNVKTGCPNTFYNSLSCLDSVYSNTDICTKAFLSYGESIGTKPSFITANIDLITGIILGLFLLANTFFFNKDFLRDAKLEEFK